MWEYRCLIVEGVSLDIVKQLNEMGENNWELCSTLALSDDEGLTSVFFFFKRRRTGIVRA